MTIFTPVTRHPGLPPADWQNNLLTAIEADPVTKIAEIANSFALLLSKSKRTADAIRVLAIPIAAAEYGVITSPAQVPSILNLVRLSLARTKPSSIDRAHDFWFWAKDSDPFCRKAAKTLIADVFVEAALRTGQPFVPESCFSSDAEGFPESFSLCLRNEYHHAFDNVLRSNRYDTCELFENIVKPCREVLLTAAAARLPVELPEPLQVALLSQRERIDHCWAMPLAIAALGARDPDPRIIAIFDKLCALEPKLADYARAKLFDNPRPSDWNYANNPKLMEITISFEDFVFAQDRRIEGRVEELYRELQWIET